MSQDFATNEATLTAAFVQQFHDTYDLAAQQNESRLVAAVESRGDVEGASFTINDMAAVEMEKTTSRFQDTKWSLPEVGTRIAFMEDFDLHIPIEPRDLYKLKAEPQNAYIKQMISANNRCKDRIVYRALIDAVMRKTENNATPAPVSLPASQIILDGGANITKAKLTKAKALFRKNECDEKNGEQLFIAYNADMLETILNDTTLTSADFLKVEMLQDGAVATNWLGFTWIPYEALDLDTDVYTTVAWCKSAAHFGTGIAGNSVDIGKRRDKNNTIQISLSSAYGGGRANEQKVVGVKFKV